MQVYSLLTIHSYTNIAVIKNQLLHVYAKNYEGNGQNLLIRLVRYSLDGELLCIPYHLVVNSFLQA